MRLRVLLAPMVAAIVLVIDQISKYLVVTNLELNQSWYPFAFLKPLFALTYIHNTGAAFGILQNQNVFFATIACIVIIIILYYVRTTPQPDLLVAFSLGLQLGGASGNLVDRIRQGYVVDFLHVKFWAISNVADMSISLGVVLLAYYLIFRAPQAESEQKSTPPAPPSPSRAEPKDN